jgi:hypothetical protein
LRPGVDKREKIKRAIIAITLVISAPACCPAAMPRRRPLERGEDWLAAVPEDCLRATWARLCHDRAEWSVYCQARRANEDQRVKSVTGSLRDAIVTGRSIVRHCRARGPSREAARPERGTTRGCFRRSQPRSAALKGPLRGGKGRSSWGIGLPPTAPQALAGDSSGRSEV